ncbi:MAG: lycopene cyclase domain-containing protein [Flavobacteriaceae bacterium]|jgi:lycopene cyclase domain-containing protein|nr:lycopene cyclase domain-containing protein [Flavobacteriaceae bacterium]MCB0486330.1 lycopene cyclase domain-containing protein [Flavobacteriaceae bacterium]
MSLYLLLNLGSIAIPLLYSFEKRMNFIKWWKEVFLSIIIVAIIFIVWDIIFTQQGIWGFNEKYLVGIHIFNLPLEEWLFFICIPYACIFTHYAFQYFFPQVRLSIKVTNGITLVILITLLVVILVNHDKAYTFYNYLFLIVLLLYSLVAKIEQLRVFYITFSIILIPFFIINGILTGSFIDEQVVWYNNYENLGIRIGTIPVEDMGYAFTMLFVAIIFIERFKKANFSDGSV